MVIMLSCDRETVNIYLWRYNKNKGGFRVMGNCNKRSIKELNILGELVCLDFTNTVGWHASENPTEWIHNYKDLLEWCSRINLITQEKKLILTKESERLHLQSSIVYNLALELRECLYRIFCNAIENKPINHADLYIFNQHLHNSFRHLTLRARGNKYYPEFNDSNTLDSVLWPIVKSALELITSDKLLTKLKQCGGGACGWIFLDTSRNRSRKWCSMNDCGNRAKVKRHYQKRNIEKNKKKKYTE